MPGGQVLGLVMTLICSGGSGLLFFSIGLYAKKRKTPMHFWAGEELDPDTILNIPAYNDACAAMWMRFSVPFFAACGFGILGAWKQWAWPCIVELGLLVLTCTCGIWWLIKTYRAIEKKFMLPH